MTKLTFEQRKEIKRLLDVHKRTHINSIRPEKFTRIRKNTREEKLRNEGFERIGENSIRCVLCGVTVHKSTGRVWIIHKSGCTNNTSTKRKVEWQGHSHRRKVDHTAKYKRKVELQGREQLRLKERNWYRRRLRREGWVLSEDGETVTCPTCGFNSSIRSAWRHYANCTSTLGGRKTTKLPLDNRADLC